MTARKRLDRSRALSQIAGFMYAASDLIHGSMRFVRIDPVRALIDVEKAKGHILDALVAASKIEGGLGATMHDSLVRRTTMIDELSRELETVIQKRG